MPGQMTVFKQRNVITTLFCALTWNLSSLTGSIMPSRIFNRIHHFKAILIYLQVESVRLCVWKTLTCRDVFIGLSPWLRVNNTWCHTRCANTKGWSLIGAMGVWRALIEIGGKDSRNGSLYCVDYYCVWSSFLASKCSKMYAVTRMCGNLPLEKN